MTRLDAVNLILRRVGYQPVQTLDTGGASLQANAERVLDETEIEVQSRGWHYNTRVNVELAAGADGKYQVPAGTLSIDTYGENEGDDLVQVGGNMYDRTENTFTVAESGTTKRFTYVLRIAYECIPYHVRRYIAVLAAQRFNEHFGSPGRARAIEAEALRAHTEAKRYDTGVSDVNLLRTAEAVALKGDRALTGRMV